VTAAFWSPAKTLSVAGTCVGKKGSKSDNSTIGIITFGILTIGILTAGIITIGVLTIGNT
jgi:hypothetical protein